MRSRLLDWILAAAVTVALAPAETACAQIGGVVTSATTGEPLKSVHVVLRFPENSESSRSVASTGPAGEFLFTHLPPGSYRLELHKAGYRPLRGGEMEMPLDSGETSVNRVYSLTPMASISGRVAGPEGAAISRVEVRAYAMHYRSGRVRLSYAGRARTDDRGEYRLYGLAAGKYILRASPPTTGPGGAFYADAASSYYPNAADPSGATPVTLHWGQEALALDIEIPDRLTYFVSGIASEARSGGPCAGCPVRVIRLDGEFALTLPKTVTASGSGMFVVRGLAPGDYKIVAAHTSDRNLVAQRPTRVDERTGDEVIHLPVGGTESVSGRVVLEGAPEDVTLPETAVLLDAENAPASWPVPEAIVSPDRTFEFQAVPPETYSVAVEPFPPGAYLKGLRIGRRELSEPRVTVEPGSLLGNVELVLGYDGAAVSGAVKATERDRAASQPIRARVFLIPDSGESEFLSVRSIETDSTGAFGFSAVAPGDYALVAFPAASELRLHDPAVRRGSTSLRLRPNESANITIRLLQSPF